MAYRTISPDFDVAINIFRDIKLIDGPMGLSSTLRRHQRLVAWLKDQALSDLTELEEGLDFYNSK